MSLNEKVKVLIVDDEPFIVEFIESMVVKAGFRVLGKAYDGPSAVSAVQDLKPDIVLMDLEMPDPQTGIDDKEAGIKAINLIQAYSPVPVVLITSYQSNDIFTKLDSSLIGAYLSKPVRASELERAIHISIARFEDMKMLRELNKALKEKNQLLEIEAGINHKIETELIKAKEMAEQESRLKSEFLATIAHEIRNPMNGVVGMTSMLLNTKLDEKQKMYVNIINRSSDVLIGLINDVLDLSKLESGKIEITEELINIHELFKDLIDLFLLKAHEKKVEIMYYIEPTIPYIRTDYLRLRQILINIIGNAVKFTQEGEIYIQVTKIEDEKSTPENFTLHIEITDTGVGIPQERIATIFEPFTQADLSITRKYGGTGLGLSICVRLIDLLSGTISATSQLGKGSTFTITIPVKSQNTNKIHVHNLELSPDFFAGKKICIIDDNPKNLKIIKTYLDVWNFNSVAVTNPLDLFQLKMLDELKESFSVLIDYEIRDTNIHDIVTKIKEFNPVASIILLVDPFKDSNIIHSSDFNGYIEKPINASNLFNKLMSLFTVETIEDTDHSQIRNDSLLFDKLSELQNKKILVAEDQDFNTIIMQEMLSSLGLNAHFVLNGKQAVDSAHKEDYDIILMDIRMPVMDGIEAARCILSDSEKSPYIIAMTADVMKQDIEKYYREGFLDCISKPMKIENVISMFEKYMISTKNKKNRGL
jgi:signal transduction histidine kinase